MKPIYILWIAIIGIAIAILVSTSGDAGSYATFAEATEAAAGGSDKSYHVAGKLLKQGDRIVDLTYDPVKDPNLCTFSLKDQAGNVRRVVYFQPKPQDIERSDVIVVVGKAKGADFVADKLILKCPSKYQEGGKNPFPDAEAQQRKA